MTLNITLVTAHRIYQSSDFMLTISKPYKVVSTSSVKVVQFQYDGITGFVSYTGVARWPREDSKETAKRIAEWLEGKPNLSLEEIAEIVRINGDNFLRRVASYDSDYRHTFTIAGFENGIPKVMLVSNYEWIDGRMLESPSDNLFVSRRAYVRSSFTVITGQRPRVRRERKKQLERLGDDPSSSGNQIRDAMARVNSLAADSCGLERIISNECSVYSIDASGHGVHELTPGSRIDPVRIVKGSVLPGLSDIANMIGMDVNGLAITGATFGTSETATPEPECQPSRVDGSTRYELHDLSVPGMGQSIPRRIGTNAGEFAVAGICSLPQNVGRYHFWIWKESFGHKTFAIDMDNAHDVLFIQDESVVVTGTADGLQGVFLLDGTARHPFDKRARSDAGACSVNGVDQVGGWIGDVTDRGQHSQRPAVWDASGNIVDLLEGGRLCGADWGYVQDLAIGKALVIAYAGNDVVLLHWTIGGPVEQIATPSQRVVGVGFSRESTVGFSTGDRELPVALVRPASGDWTRVDAEAGWLPQGCDSHGNICGRVLRGGFSVPIRWAEGESVQLSSYRYHHTEASYISDGGSMLGRATADHGIHALLWRPMD